MSVSMRLLTDFDTASVFLIRSERLYSDRRERMRTRCLEARLWDRSMTWRTTCVVDLPLSRARPIKLHAHYIVLRYVAT